MLTHLGSPTWARDFPSSGETIDAWYGGLANEGIGGSPTPAKSNALRALRRAFVTSRLSGPRPWQPCSTQQAPRTAATRRLPWSGGADGGMSGRSPVACPVSVGLYLPRAKHAELVAFRVDQHCPRRVIGLTHIHSSCAELLKASDLGVAILAGVGG